MWNIFKSLLNDDRTYVSLLLILVAVTSFGLGKQSQAEQPTAAAPAARLMVAPEATPEVLLPTVPTSPVDALAKDTVELVASKNGSKYHLPTCPGAKQIAEQNKISFASVAAARAAGYTPAANCPGLQ